MSSATLIQAQAARFVTRLYSGELTAREERHLQEWRQQSPQHEAEFQAMLATWDMTGHLFQNPQQRRRPGVRRGWWAAAASIALVGVVSWQLWQASEPVETVTSASPHIVSVSTPDSINLSAPVQFRITEQKLESTTASYQTQVGEVSHVSLTDGSMLSLNTDTEVEVTFTANLRHVVLVRGEAFFDVAPDETRPFHIDTGRKLIEVVGTQFNVRKRADETVIKVSVLEGKVAVRATKSETTETIDQASAAPTETDVTLLTAGDIGAYSESSEVVTQNQVQAVSSAQSWRRGVFRFDDEPLEHVIREFNRYRERKIVIADASVAELRISGVFHLKNGDNILTALESTLPVQFDRSEQQVTARRR
ncbi:MAG TPA: FecR domain-containing protein [Pseudidiomarina sp.]|nr:FecR domain-containing protein [Pseudidiomarina sp.]